MFFRKNSLLSGRRFAPALLALGIWHPSGAAAAEDWPIGAMIGLEGGGVPGGAANATSANGSVIVGTILVPTDEVGFFDFHAAYWSNGSVTAHDLASASGLGSSYAVAVSGDGSVIVGNAFVSSPDGPTQHGVAWIGASNTFVDLGALGGSYSQARAISADGSTIVGSSSIVPNTTDGHAAVWRNGATAPTDLGALAGYDYSDALAISADGTVIVGQSSDYVNGIFHATSWTNGATLPVDLGTLGGNYSTASAISGDGSVIIGQSNTIGGSYFAVSWRNGATTPMALETLGGSFNYARAVNEDGSVIVGSSDVAGNVATHAAAWLGGSTTPTDLGLLGGHNAEAIAVSADGTVIAGNSETSDNSVHAVVWTGGATTPTDLGTLGGSISQATALSADGTVVVGRSNIVGDSQFRLFVLRLAASPDMQDLGNLAASFVLLANDTALAIERQTRIADSVMDSGCTVKTGGRWCASISGVGQFDDGRSDTGVGVLSLGWALTDRFTAGVSLAGGSSGHMDSGAVDMGLNWFGGAWLNYSADQATHTGWQATAGIAYGEASGTAVRGLGLDNVELAPGDFDLGTLGARVTAGYGFAVDDWVLTPSVGFEVFHSKRSSYDEAADIDFPASFKSLQTTSSTATLAVAAGHSAGAHGRVELQGGAVADLDYDDPTVIATSTIPGLESVSQKQALDRNGIRPFFGATYTFQPEANWSVTLDSRLERAEFGGSLNLSTAARLGVSF